MKVKKPKGRVAPVYVSRQSAGDLRLIAASLGKSIQEYLEPIIRPHLAADLKRLANQLNAKSD